MTAGWHAPTEDRMACLLCGDARDVTMALVRYTDGIYNSIPRCRDHHTCRDRVEATGGRWEVADPAPRFDRTRRTR